MTSILDIAPLNEGHILILPKKHYHDVDDLDEITANEIMKTSAIIARLLKVHFQPDGITVIQNGGKFNDLTHYHMHVFPRYDSDGFAWLEPPDTTNAKGRLNDTREKLLKLGNGGSYYANGQKCLIADSLHKSGKQNLYMLLSVII